jgi:hypothetical protein
LMEENLTTRNMCMKEQDSRSAQYTWHHHIPRRAINDDQTKCKQTLRQASKELLETTDKICVAVCFIKTLCTNQNLAAINEIKTKTNVWHSTIWLTCNL